MRYETSYQQWKKDFGIGCLACCVGAMLLFVLAIVGLLVLIFTN